MVWYCPHCEQPARKDTELDASWIERHLALELYALITAPVQGKLAKAFG